MPRRKASRVASRAKPTLPSEDQSQADMCRQQREQKIKLLLRDFDIEAEKRIKKMEEEVEMVVESIRNMYKMDLLAFPESTRNALWTDVIKEEEKKALQTSKDTKNAVNDIISSAESVVQSAAKKRGRKPKGQKLQEHAENEFMPPPKVTRTGTRGTRNRPVLGSNHEDNMPQPPPSKRAKQGKSVHPAQPFTPLNTALPPSAHLYVTPKFDPRTPLPAGTLKRNPLLGEVAISLQGSPLQVSPTTNIKDWLNKVEPNNADSATMALLMELKEKVEKVLDTKVVPP